MIVNENLHADFPAPAMRALSMLIKIGPLLRDRYTLMNLRPEPFFAKSVRNYLRWAESDAGFHHGRQAPEILSIAVDDTRDGSDADKVIMRLEARMRKNAAEWRSWSGKQPKQQRKLRPNEESRQDEDEDINEKIASAAVANEEEEDIPDGGVAALTTTPVSPFTMTLDDGVCANGGEQTNENRRGAVYRPRRRHRSAGFSGVMNWMTRVFTGNMDGPGDEPPSPGDEDTGDNTPAVDAVYGIAVSHLVVAILSYHVYRDNEGDDGRARENEGRTGGDSARVLFFVDFSDPTQDVWNSIAIAMAVCHCRDVRVANSFMGTRNGANDDDDDDGMDL